MATRTRVNYHKYLASREWGLIKKQVRDRSRGRCERCGAKQEATHHLTYERLGHERLEDLQAVCNPCHEFLSGISNTDPAQRGTSPERLVRLLAGLEELARGMTDGHVTLYRFTTGWKILFGTPEMPEHVRHNLYENQTHPTLAHALEEWASEWTYDVDGGDQ